MSYFDYDYTRYGKYFADKWQFDAFMRKVDQCEYQLLADIETTRIELLNTSLSRANHWFLVLCVDGNRSRAKALYGPFATPGMAMAELRTVESFIKRIPENLQGQAHYKNRLGLQVLYNELPVL